MTIKSGVLGKLKNFKDADESLIIAKKYGCTASIIIAYQNNRVLNVN